MRSFVFLSLFAIAFFDGDRGNAVVVGPPNPVEADVQASGHRIAYKYSRISSKPDDEPPSTMVDHQVQQRVDDIKKSVSDSRVYRGLVLKNGLTVLLISDPETDLSAASLSVAVGKLFILKANIFTSSYAVARVNRQNTLPTRHRCMCAYTSQAE